MSDHQLKGNIAKAGNKRGMFWRCDIDCIRVQAYRTRNRNASQADWSLISQEILLPVQMVSSLLLSQYLFLRRSAALHDPAPLATQEGSARCLQQLSFNLMGLLDTPSGRSAAAISRYNSFALAEGGTHNHMTCMLHTDPTLH